MVAQEKSVHANNYFQKCTQAIDAQCLNGQSAKSLLAAADGGCTVAR
jgi:hypothetical protein